MGQLLLRKQSQSGKPLNDMDYLLGVSDKLRLGALRISLLETPNHFLDSKQEVPRLIDLEELEEAGRKLEANEITVSELNKLMGTGTSMGGAKPKAVIVENNVFYLAKFQPKDSVDRIALWEATALDLAAMSGISVCEHRILNKNSNHPIFLAKRFDRDENGRRIPFASAMTLAGIPMSDAKSDYSYVELADLIKKYKTSKNLSDLSEMWLRMVFNACVGNVDDHLKNHGFLRINNEWKLSPAYDIVPFAKQKGKVWPHAIGFEPDVFIPSLKMFEKIGIKSFGLSVEQMDKMFFSLGKALSQWKMVAKNNGLKANEINLMQYCFVNELNLSIINKTNKSKSLTNKTKLI
jgi:serine/threonine-protein kinase HipA